MRKRTGTKATLKFNYKTGIEEMEVLDKLAVSLKNIKMTKTIIQTTLNKEIKSTIMPKYYWLGVPAGLLISILGMLFVPNHYGLVFLVLGIILIMILLIYKWSKTKRLNYLFEKTRKRIYNKTKGMVQANVDKDFCLIMLESKVTLFPTISNLIIKTNKTGEFQSFVIKTLDKNSNIIRKTNSITDFYTNDIKIEENKLKIETQSEIGKTIRLSDNSSKKIIPIIPLK